MHNRYFMPVYPKCGMDTAQKKLLHKLMYIHAYVQKKAMHVRHTQHTYVFEYMYIHTYKIPVIHTNIYIYMHMRLVQAFEN